VSMPSSAWTIIASPGFAVSAVAGPQLAYRTIADLDPPQVTVTFGNPFDWPPALRLAWNAYRLVTLPGSPVQVPLYTGVQTTTAAVNDAPGLMDAPIPTSIRIGATSLENDQVPFPIDRAHPVEISATFDFDSEVPGVVYVATVFTFEGGGAAGFTKRVHAEFLARRPVWRVPAEIFDAGATYFIRVAEYPTGFAGIDEGTVAVMPTVTVGFLDSGVFTVQ